MLPGRVHSRRAPEVRMRRAFTSLLLALACIAPCLPARVAGAEAPSLRRVLLVSIDGLRPDVLLRADTPVLHALMRRGSFTMWAQTTAVSVTLPSHVSMLTGVPPSTHGIEWNSDLPLKRPIYPAVPTLFELARSAGLSTAMVAGKSKFTALVKPGTLDWAFVPAKGVIGDDIVADTAVRLIESHAPQVLFVHLPGVDSSGHASGWGSDAQLAAAATADRCLGRLLDALDRRRLLDSTCVLVSADHGGAGKSHGPDDPRSRNIPWIIAGPGIRRNFDLTTVADVVVRTEDTFGTLCALLGLSPPARTVGRLVPQVLEAEATAGERR
jgi:predicted AlkP superfamily pyrophosphatase or phosphodiesterase